MTYDCERALALVPAYLDGELDEQLSGPLRRHLMDCQPCRTATQGERAQKRWFLAEAVMMQIPPGFAARVARRAFAGDGGDTESGAVIAAKSDGRKGEILPFVLRATAAAAVLLIVLAGLLRNSELPQGSGLRAEDQTPPSLEELLRELDRLDRTQPALPAESEAGR